MVNLTVINLKTIIKKVIKLAIRIICLVIIFFILRKIIILCENKNLISAISLDYKKIIESRILIFNKKEVERESNLKKILASELTIFDAEEELMEKENQEEILELSKENTEKVINTETAEKIELQPNEEKITKLSTKIIEENNKVDRFTDFYGSVKIKNESNYTLTQDIVTPNIEFKNKKEIIIYHTHTCESYTPTEVAPYVASGNFRTIDLENSIARVGKELSINLNKKGFNVIQNSTYHDYPAYSGSYTRALATITSLLKKNPKVEFIIDLHRDALGSNSNYAPSVQIGDDICAQLMFVMGTDGGGLKHPNWISNLKLAIKIQEKANEMYPGLFKPMILRNSRYNQHVTTGACIIEVGATGNTLEQCNKSMKYLANVIEEIMK